MIKIDNKKSASIRAVSIGSNLLIIPSEGISSFQIKKTTYSWNK